MIYCARVRSRAIVSNTSRDSVRFAYLPTTLKPARRLSGNWAGLRCQRLVIPSAEGTGRKSARQGSLAACQLIQPTYFLVLNMEVVKGRKLIVQWPPGEDLTKGCSTGGPKKFNVMVTNGSAAPLFETDDERPSHVKRLPMYFTGYEPPATTEVAALLNVVVDEMSRQELQAPMGLRSCEQFRQAYVLPAITGRMPGMALRSTQQSVATLPSTRHRSALIADQ